MHEFFSHSRRLFFNSMNLIYGLFSGKKMENNRECTKGENMVRHHKVNHNYALTGTQPRRPGLTL